mgnify:CR=1 FL=1
MFLKEYISDVFKGVKILADRHETYRLVCIASWKRKITQQYPDNKDTLVLPERFRGEVVMIHDEHNEHACTGCTACELACPNATIKIVTKFDIQPDGKRKKRLTNLYITSELCTFCNLCIEACPTECDKNGAELLNTVYSTEQT